MPAPPVTTTRRPCQKPVIERQFVSPMLCPVADAPAAAPTLRMGAPRSGRPAARPVADRMAAAAPGVLRAGTSTTQDAVLPVWPNIEAEHCLLERTGGEDACLVHPIGVCWLNGGELLDSSPLRDGDVVGFGGADAGAPPPAPPPPRHSPTIAAQPRASGSCSRAVRRAVG